MSADQTGGSELKPVKPERVAREIKKLSAARRNGEITASDYDQRFARVIQELRERRIDGSRAEIDAALQPLVSAGDITQQEFDRLRKQLGMM